MAAWAAGIQLGPYVLLAPIGAGGMGEVWKARDTRLERIVAIKRLKGRHTARFEKEARAIAALNHPHICQIHDIGPDYLVLEYIDGNPLTGPLPVGDAVRCATQIAEALDAAHRKRVIHRDLKPANIMVTSEGAIKLLDFGIATHAIDSDETQSMEGRVIGTAAYMSPEQAAGKSSDARSDVFSFGTVLYELLSGRRAFSGENAVSTMAAILHKEPAPLEAPTALQQIVKRCLMKAPNERFQTMAEVLLALAGGIASEQSVRPSIAVLPFANMSGDKDNEYFSDGLAEEIINALAQNAGLMVIARTSAFAFRGKEQDIRKIAEALDVKTILEGSVRRAGNRIRVMAQLINAADGSHLWSQRYDREMADIFELQDEIAQAISAALHVKLSGSTPLQNYKPNLPAYDAFLRARYLAARGDLNSLAKAKDLFDQAISLDSGFALAYCECGICFVVMAGAGLVSPDQALSAARTYATKALELDPHVPEGHAVLGSVEGTFDNNWKGAEKRFTTARTREPIPRFVRYLYAFSYLVEVGRPAEAIQEIEQALLEDPLNVMFRGYRAALLSILGRDLEALEEARRILELNPASAGAHFYVAVEQFMRGDLEKALASAQETYSLAPRVPNVKGLLAGLLHRTGECQSRNKTTAILLVL